MSERFVTPIDLSDRRLRQARLLRRCRDMMDIDPAAMCRRLRTHDPNVAAFDPPTLTEWESGSTPIPAAVLDAALALVDDDLRGIERWLPMVRRQGRPDVSRRHRGLGRRPLTLVPSTETGHLPPQGVA